MLNFQPLKLEDLETYQRFYQLCDVKCSDYTFVNMWAWNDKYKFELAYDGDICWICSHEDKTPRFFSPIGNWRQCDWTERFAEVSENGAWFYKVPESLLHKIKASYPGKIIYKEDRANWEYIYKVRHLIELNGQKYRNKRKALNQFKELYDYEYKPMTKKDIPEVLAFQKQWLEQSEAAEEKNLINENKAIKRVLEHWDYFKDVLTGGILYINSEIIAYTIGEFVADNTLIIHFEKALYNFRGAYAAINQIFLENSGPIKYVNREQDLGDGGLRKAKMEYRPLKFIKKYNLFCCSKH